MKLLLDRKKEYGVVLDGGGARGAYQIGAWKPGFGSMQWREHP